MKSKKSQLLILSVFYFTLLLVFIYSLETQNYYIPSKQENTIVDSLSFETCYTAKTTNGSYLEARLSGLEIAAFKYCDSIGFFCNLSITPKASLPSNVSLINYSLFTYHLDFHDSQISLNKDIWC